MSIDPLVFFLECRIHHSFGRPVCLPTIGKPSLPLLLGLSRKGVLFCHAATALQLQAGGCSVASGLLFPTTVLDIHDDSALLNPRQTLKPYYSPSIKHQIQALPRWWLFLSFFVSFFVSCFIGPVICEVTGPLGPSPLFPGFDSVRVALDARVNRSFSYPPASITFW